MKNEGNKKVSKVEKFLDKHFIKILLICWIGWFLTLIIGAGESSFLAILNLIFALPILAVLWGLGELNRRI